jgi:RNA repair pathway DNA polymerase beta family
LKDRTIIFETRVGSHLYGTSRPDSDEDFQGVFIPSKEDLLGIQNCPTEWSLNEKLSTTIQNQKGDVDRKFYSLKRFLDLAAEGQPGQLELLFATPKTTVSYSPIWSKILDNTQLFLCRKSIVPFVGFALSQAYKASIKGENLNIIRDIIGAYPEPIKSSLTIQSVSTVEKNGNEQWAHVTPNNKLKLVTNSHGFTTVEIGGKNYDYHLKLKTFIANLKEMEAKYGKRARAAADTTYDYKSLMHAYRLLGEAEELLKTGKITFPLPHNVVQFLMTVRNGTCGDLDHWGILNNKIDDLRKIEKKSFLPEEANRAAINKLCVQILSDSLKENT